MHLANNIKMTYGPIRYAMVFSLMALFCYSIGAVFDLDFESLSPFQYLTLSILLHTMTYLMLRTKKDKDIRSLKRTKTTKYASSTLTESEMYAVVDKVLGCIARPEVFSNSELRLRDVADHLSVSSYHISQSINLVTGKSFFELVNERRIEAFKENVSKPDYKNYTLAAIAAEFGFKSSSTFYRVFKQNAGITPKKFISETGLSKIEG